MKITNRLFHSSPLDVVISEDIHLNSIMMEKNPKMFFIY